MATAIRYAPRMAAQPLTASRADRRWLALTWLIFLLTAAALLVSIVLWARVDFAVPPITFYRSSWIVLMQWLLILAPGTVGLLLGLRLAGSTVAIALSGIGLEGIAARRYQAPAGWPGEAGRAATSSAAPLAAGALLTEETLRAFIAEAVREELARRDGE